MALGLGVFWIGYTLSYFGYCSVRGPGVGLFDLIVPGRTVVIPGSSGPGGSGPGGLFGSGKGFFGDKGFAPGTTISPGPDGTSIVTPPNGGQPYQLVPVGGGNYSQEPLPPGEGGPLPGGAVRT